MAGASFAGAGAVRIRRVCNAAHPVSGFSGSGAATGSAAGASSTALAVGSNSVSASASSAVPSSINSLARVSVSSVSNCAPGAGPGECRNSPARNVFSGAWFTEDATEDGVWLGTETAAPDAAAAMVAVCADSRGVAVAVCGGVAECCFARSNSQAVLIVSRTCSARIGFSRTELAPAFNASGRASSVTIAKVSGRCAAFRSRAVFNRNAASG